MSCPINSSTFASRVRHKLRHLFSRKSSQSAKSLQTLEQLEPRLLMAADVIISEIMYHPSALDAQDPGEAERTNLEWLEIYNRDSQTVTLENWRISKGVDFTFPNVSLNPGEYLVVAADVASFQAEYPGVTNVVGGWTGKLSNSSEEITLEDELGDTADRVDYADEGAWAQRTEKAQDIYGESGWQWVAGHDGEGMTLEVMNLSLSNNHGHNWNSSVVVGGTPGAVNSVNSNDIAPIIVSTDQFPIIPTSTDSVTITAEILDEQSSGLDVSLFWRVDGNTNFTQVTMLDDGTNGDEVAGDGLFIAQIPPQADGTIIEYYVEAEDAGNQSRAFPNYVSSVSNIMKSIHDTAKAGEVVGNPTQAAGQFGQAIELNGNDYVRLETEFIKNYALSTFTLATWIYRTGDGEMVDTGNMLAEPIITKGNENARLNYFMGLTDNGGDLVLASEFQEHFFLSPNPNDYHSLVGTTPILNDTWYHVAVTFDEVTGDYNLYLNGNLEASDTQQVLPNFITGAMAAIGTSLGANDEGFPQGEFVGRMDETYILSDALDQAGIQTLQTSNTTTGAIEVQFDYESISIELTANLLYQVDDSFNETFNPGSEPFFRLITTENEKLAFDYVNRNSTAEFNATFVSHDGTDLKVRHNTSFRVRGASSPRNNAAPPTKIEFRSDDKWEGVDNINLNTNFGWLQTVGMAFSHLSGLVTTNAQIVTMTINGVNEALNTTPASGGVYAWIEQPDGDFINRAYPNSGLVNTYQKRRPDTNWAFHNGDVAEYLNDGWEKANNGSENDWSDLDNFLNVMNNASVETYVDDISPVVDIEQWVKWFAVNAFLNTQETNLSNGHDDDYDMAFNATGKAQLIPHDFDSILDQGYGAGSDVNETIFSAIDPNTPLQSSSDAHPQLVPFFQNDTIVRMYYSALRDLANSVFTAANFDPIIDQILGGNADTQTIAEMKAYMVARRASILGQIPSTTTISTSLPLSGGYYVSTLDQAAFNGTAPGIETQSVLVNNIPVDYDAFTGTWSLGDVVTNTTTFVAKESEWTYLDQIQNGLQESPAVAAEDYPLDGQNRVWSDPDFDINTSDPGIGTWLTGSGIFEAGTINYVNDGFGTANTTLDGIDDAADGSSNAVTTYLFRKTFDVVDPSITTMTMNLLSDDGGVLYINGTEVYRHLFDENDVITTESFANGTGDEDEYLAIDIDVTGLLVAGTNHIAYELHQVNASSSDVGFDLELVATSITPGTGLDLNPGVNRVVVQAFDGENGTGNLIGEDFVDVYYNDGSNVIIPGGDLAGVEAQEANVIIPSSFIPGVPFLVQVESAGAVSGDIDRHLWDAIASLSITNPDMTIDVNSVSVSNGSGTALVTATPSAAPIGGASAEEQYITAGSSWSFLDDGSDQGTAWREAGYDDSSWDTGLAQLGYGGNGEVTTVGFIDTDPVTGGTQKNATTYFRMSFNVTNAADVDELRLRLVRDDGAAVYLNGTRIHTFAISIDAPYDEFASATIGGSDETTFFESVIDLATFPVGTLVEGTNVIAVEIHQADDSSSDISFDLELFGTTNEPTEDITLNVDLNGMLTNKAMTSLDPGTATSVSGVLAGADLNWSGIVHVTGDVTVNAADVLTIAAGTIVIVDGNPAANATDGVNIIVNGRIDAQGTESDPITITAADANAPWGRILHSSTSTGNQYSYTQIHRAGHSAGGGRIGHGHAMNLDNSDATFDHVTISDVPGTLIIADNSTINATDSTFTRAVNGLDLTDTNLMLTNSSVTEMRDANHDSGSASHNDAIYINNPTTTATAVLNNVVVGQTDDDGFDTDFANLTINNSVIRDMADKGMSIDSSFTNISYSVIANNASGIVSGNSGNNNPNTDVDHVTFSQNAVGYVRVPSDAPSNKSTIANSIIRGGTPIDTGGTSTEFTVEYSNIEGGFTGTGNIDQDPQFVNAVNNDFRLTASSPSLDAADPNDPLDADGTVQDQGAYYFDQNTLGGSNEIVWSPAGGIYRVTGNLIIPENMTLTIEPGTTVFFDPGAGMTVHGTLDAQGTVFNRIRLARTPGTSGDWEGIEFDNSAGGGFTPFLNSSVMSYVDMDSGDGQGHSIGVTYADVLIDHMTWSDVSRTIVEVSHPRIVVQNSILPSVNAEYIHGTGFDSGEYLIIESNLFQFSSSGDDVVDVLGPRRPGSVFEVRNNIFLGGGDDGIDLDGNDAHVEGNIFMNFTLGTSRPTTSNAIATGEPQTGAPNSTEAVVVRNVFYNNDHGVLLKEDSFLHAEHNLFLDNTTAVDGSSAAVVFDEPGGSAVDGPGKGAYLNHNIFWNNGLLFDLMDNVVDPTQITSINNIIDNAAFAYPDGASVSNNVQEDPRIINPAGLNFNLGIGSPAFSPDGANFNLGPVIKGGANVTGNVLPLTHESDVTLTIEGPGLYSVAWKLDNGAWSADIPLVDPATQDAQGLSRAIQVQINGLTDGEHTVYVRGIDSAGKLRDGDEIGTFTWTIDSALSELRINEVLASNTGAFDNAGTTPDVIELFNHSATARDIGGMYLSDDPLNPTKYMIPLTTTIDADGFMAIFADSNVAAPGLHTGFGLNADGDAVYLYDVDGTTLLDSIEFGLQLENMSIGRVGGSGTWALNQPTIGAENIEQRTGNTANLTINEWFANGSVFFNDDFVEIFNKDNLPIDMGGLFMTDNLATEPDKHQIPALSFISGSGFLEFDADGDTQNGNRHLGFKLSSDQGRVHLLDSTQHVIDQVIYFAQTTDVSQGRVNDGESTFQFLTLPSPGATNNPDGSEHLVLIDSSQVWDYLDQIENGLQEDPAIAPEDYPTDGQGREWFENDFDVSTSDAAIGTWLTGSGNFAGGNIDGFGSVDVALEGIDDAFDGSSNSVNTYLFRTTFNIADASLISELDFSILADDGGVLYLNEQPILTIGTFTDDPITTISGPTTAGSEFAIDYSVNVEGLLTSGTNYLAFELHQNNSTSSDAGFALTMEADTIPNPNFQNLVDGLRITELNYNPAGTDGTEFIELKNVGDVPLDLEGVRLDDAISFTFPAMTLNPGEFTLVVRDPIAFEAAYGNTLPVAGQYGGALSNGDEQVILRLPAPFNAAILRFTYEDNWYRQTDNGGYSLVTANEDQARERWDKKTGWRSSYEIAGSPGADDVVEFIPPVATETVWDDTDIVHVLRTTFNEFVGHTLSGQDILLFNITSNTIVNNSSINFNYDYETQVMSMTFPGLVDATLPDGNYLLTINASGVSDLSGNLLDGDNNGIGGDNYNANFSVVSAVIPTVTVDIITTIDSTPSLSGNVDDPAATITVTVNNQTLPATNLGNGTWILADNLLSPLADGAYDVEVTATNIAGSGSDNTTDELRVDAVPPVVTVDFLSTSDSTPALSGTIIDEPIGLAQNISVEVDGLFWNATNNNDGTWSLADNTINALADGTYDVSVVAFGSNGNGFDQTTGELTIDTARPTVSVVSSQLNQVVFQFSEDVSGSLDKSDFVFENITHGQTLGASDFDLTYNPDNTVVVTFTSVVSASATHSGRYDITINAAGVTDAVGNELDGDNNGSAAADFTGQEIIAIPGDLNFDCVVNIADLAVLASSFNQNGAWEQGDFSGDGFINIADLAKLASNFNETCETFLVRLGGGGGGASEVDLLAEAGAGGAITAEPATQSKSSKVEEALQLPSTNGDDNPAAIEDWMHITSILSPAE